MSETTATLVQAKGKYLRITPKKVNRLLHLIRRKDAQEALNILKLMPQAGAKYIEKVLKSAIANAVNNNKLKKEELYVNEAIVGSGIIMKRYRAGGRGSPAKIEKLTSHITITLGKKGVK